MVATLKIEDVVKTIEKESIAPNQDTRIVKELAIGKGIRQGDVYLIRIDPSHPIGEVLFTQQLVVGTVQGSRHIVEGGKLYASTSWPKGISRTAILGPIVRAKKRFTVTHPEHAHFVLPAGTYQCIQQLDARTRKAVQD